MTPTRNYNVAEVEHHEDCAVGWTCSDKCNCGADPEVNEMPERVYLNVAEASWRAFRYPGLDDQQEYIRADLVATLKHDPQA